MNLRNNLRCNHKSLIDTASFFLDEKQFLIFAEKIKLLLEQRLNSEYNLKYADSYSYKQINAILNDVVNEYNKPLKIRKIQEQKNKINEILNSMK